ILQEYAQYVRPEDLPPFVYRDMYSSSISVDQPIYNGGTEITALRNLILKGLESVPTVEAHEVGADWQAREQREVKPAPSMEEMEKELIARTLREVGGNRRKAAKLLGIGERTLYRKLDKYGLS
ncbi:MAG: helix-turn-helix domain-containing protein, partial [Candidatus Zixiibacteriota bacterium]